MGEWNKDCASAEQGLALAWNKRVVKVEQAFLMWNKDCDSVDQGLQITRNKHVCQCGANVFYCGTKMSPVRTKVCN